MSATPVLLPTVSSAGSSNAYGRCRYTRYTLDGTQFTHKLYKYRWCPNNSSRKAHLQRGDFAICIKQSVNLRYPNEGIGIADGSEPGVFTVVSVRSVRTRGLMTPEAICVGVALRADRGSIKCTYYTQGVESSHAVALPDRQFPNTLCAR